MRDEKLHAVVVRSTFPRCCGAKHISKSTCAKHHMFAPFLDVQMSFRVAGAVQETCSSEMLGGQGGDFLRGVAFWSIRCAGLLR